MCDLSRAVADQEADQFLANTLFGADFKNSPSITGLANIGKSSSILLCVFEYFAFHFFRDKSAESSFPPELKNWDYDVVQEYLAGCFLGFVHMTSFDVNLLPAEAMHLVTIYGIVEHLKLNEATLFSFFTTISQGYFKNNPFHNANHAADVLTTPMKITCVGYASFS